MKWIQDNFEWLSLALLMAAGQLISANVWIGKYPVSIFVGGVSLLIVASASLLFVRFIDKLLLVAAYLWTNWKIIQMFSAIYLQYGIEPTSANPDNTLFLSISIWSLLGFGPILPSELSRFWVQIEAIMGLISNGILITLIFRLLTPWQQLVNR